MSHQKNLIETMTRINFFAPSPKDFCLLAFLKLAFLCIAFLCLCVVVVRVRASKVKYGGKKETRFRRGQKTVVENIGANTLHLVFCLSVQRPTDFPLVFFLNS